MWKRPCRTNVFKVQKNVTETVSDGNASLEELPSVVVTVDKEGSIIVGASIVDDLTVDSVSEAIVESVISVVLGSESELHGAIVTKDRALEGLQSPSITVEEEHLIQKEKGRGRPPKDKSEEGTKKVTIQKLLNWLRRLLRRKRINFPNQRIKRKKKNTIRDLVTDDGQKLETFEAMTLEMVKFFSHKHLGISWCSPIKGPQQ
ncbi:hypothetical protein V6N11_042966 [Hibiscus sabdariffa]|uniref:Uncharacterized protein n=1 Tax=Hibiscus sabdariffa TaxID=183260 RepID=A0ABR2QY54_9ROSI